MNHKVTLIPGGGIGPTVSSLRKNRVGLNGPLTTSIEAGHGSAPDIGGQSGTSEITKAVIEKLH